MSGGDSPGSYTIELTTRRWQIIDGTMDNEVSVEDASTSRVIRDLVVAQVRDQDPGVEP